MFSISDSPLEQENLVSRVSDESAGALVIFEGRVRNHNLGRTVSSLSYTSHPKLAEPEGLALVAETKEKFPDVTAIAASHRIGKLAIGEVAVIIAVTSPHRPAAFAACDYLAQQLKHRLPVWKEEHFADGEDAWT